MARRKEPPRIEPDIPPHQAIPVLEKQLAALQNLKGKAAREVEAGEEEWENFTKNVIARAFGDPSRNLSDFYGARAAGVHSMMGISEHQRDLNLAQRIEKYEALLKSCIAELRLFVPETEVKGSYEPGQEYEFYRDLKTILQGARSEIFIVDPYLDDRSFDLYVEKVAQGVSVRALTGKVKGTLGTVAEKYARRGNFELRSSPDIHDRIIFVDDRGWVVGQSIKDAAREKPTYMVELNDPSQMRAIHDQIWSQASVVVRG